MRNLIQLILRFQNFFLFLLLEAVCFFLILSSNPYQQAKFFHSGNLFAGNILRSYSSFTDYLNLKQVNDSLALENAVLRRQLTHINEIETIEVDTFTVQDTAIIDTPVEPQYHYIPARVINNSTNKTNNYLTLGKGSKAGIKPEMGVISKDGTVGVVVSVSKNFSVVMSLLHINSRLSAKLVRQNYSGNISWDAKNPRVAQMKDVPKHVVVLKGDSIVTSGYSSFFPAGIPVGIVRQAGLAKGDNFYNIELQWAANFQNLEYVYVIDYTHKSERKELESNQP